MARAPVAAVNFLARDAILFGKKPVVEPLTHTNVAWIGRCHACRDALQAGCRADFSLKLVYASLFADACPETLIGATPDVIILESAPLGRALKFAAQIREGLPRAKQVFVTAKASDIYLQQALSAGAKGIVLEEEPVTEILRHAKRTAQGLWSFSPSIAARLSYDSKAGQYRLKCGTAIDSLSELQLQILRLLALGDSLKMVASKTQLSRKSVDGHKYRIMKKLGLGDRVLLSRFAIREGLVEP